MCPVSKKKKKPKKKNPHKVGGKTVRYVCLQCNIEEDIPEKVVRYFDVMDDGDPTVPPRFSCEACGGEMRPNIYNGFHGQKYELNDRTD